MSDEDEEEIPDIIRKEMENIPESSYTETESVEVRGRTVEIWDEHGDPEKDLIMLMDHRDGLEQKHLRACWKIIEEAKEKYYEDYESEELGIIEEEKKRIKEKYMEKLEKIEKMFAEPMREIAEELRSF